jgi:hypothetical protein
MQLSWSVSRDQTLHNCERCYYFQYLAEAKINSRDQTLREIALLKKLKNIPMWQGDAFHAAIADYLRDLKSGKQPSLDQLIDSLKNQMLMLSRMRDYVTSHSPSGRYIKKASLFNEQSGGLQGFKTWHYTLLQSRDKHDLSTKPFSAVHG